MRKIKTDFKKNNIESSCTCDLCNNIFNVAFLHLPGDEMEDFLTSFFLWGMPSAQELELI